jgi:hypothetical protein
MSVTRALNPGEKWLVATNEIEMSKRLGDVTEHLGQLYSRHMRNLGDRRIIGVMYYVITPAVVDEIDLLSSGAANCNVSPCVGW